MNFDDGIFLDKKSESDYYRELKNDGLIPGWLTLAKIMKLPESKAKDLYRQAQLDVVDETTGKIRDSGYGDFEE